MGGEKRSGKTSIMSLSGSPPHGRGKVCVLNCQGSGDGITPAWAGKSLCPQLPGFWRWDHPRMGGEKSISAPSWGPGTGSPPHGRGKAAVIIFALFSMGITPAWAGKSQQATECALSCLGSPPHGRGKDPTPANRKPCTRITPAWAGKSSLSMWSGCCCRDHPRMGGEKLHALLQGHLFIGSPPHGRGKARLVLAAFAAARITPVWAGKRLQFFGLSAARGDHPRMGGEKAGPRPHLV